MVNALPPESGAGAPAVTERQLRDGREALRDWLGVGRNGLTVTNMSLDRVLTSIVVAMRLQARGT
jgi:hypothetical protein